jgi:hypothetical protein
MLRHWLRRRDNLEWRLAFCDRVGWHAVMTNADEVLLVAAGFDLMVWSSRLRAVVPGRCVPMQCSAAAPVRAMVGFILEIRPRDRGTPMVRQAAAQGRGT